MPKQVVLVGPAGTGKTTALLEMTQERYKSGVSSREMAYLTFTNAAANEAATRIMDTTIGSQATQEDFPYFRTIHSLAFRGLKRAKGRDIRPVTMADMKGFSQWSSLNGTFACDKWEDIAAVYQKIEGGGKTVWDECLRAYSISRISARDEKDLEASRHKMAGKAIKAIGFLEEKIYRMFVEKYEAYKVANNLVDFTDMLEFALKEMPPIDDVRHVVIDECQDLGPLLYSICDRLFPSADMMVWAGDDAQAIYLFAGAEAKLFIDRFRKADAQVFLRQTHRFGAQIVNLSDKIIRRVSDRIDKEVWGVEGRVHKVRMTGTFEPYVGDALVLHRHVVGCQALGQIYKQNGLPFRNERGEDPLGAHRKVDAFLALTDLADGKEVSGFDASELIHKYMYSQVPGSKIKLLERGVVSKLKAEKLPGQMNIKDLISAKILTSEGAEAIRMKYMNCFDGREDFQYYQSVLDNGYKLSGEGIPVITTIHGSKGRQAQKVIVCSEMGSKCWEDIDSEHRLAYVASTRTKGDFEVCADQNVEWAKERYDYPVEPKDESDTT